MIELEGDLATNGGAEPRLRHTPVDRPPLLLPNLLQDVAELGPLLLHELQRGVPLNAYLLAAGLNQIVEDDLHRCPYALDSIAQEVAPIRRPMGGLAAGYLRRVGVALWHLRARQPYTRRLLRWQTNFAGLVQCLAEIAIVASPPAPEQTHELIARAEASITSFAHFPPRLLREVIRLPSAFRSFDQQPDDLARLAQRFSWRWPDQQRPLAVVGVRTSGSYLAPLQAAFLRACGYRDVHVLTYRPGHPMFGSERMLLREIVRRDGLVLLTDDPPERGTALAEAAAELTAIAVPARAIVLLVQLFGTPDTLPAALRRYERVVLPWEEWHIQGQIAPKAVQSTLRALLGPSVTVGDVEALPLTESPPVRGHVRRLYQLQLIGEAGRNASERRVYVKGAGLGYFGEHSLAIAKRLPGFIPEVFGFRDGLLYHAWPQEDSRLSLERPAERQAAVAAVVRYTLARHAALTVSADVSLRLARRRPVWESAADMLNEGFGRVAPLTRPMLRLALKHLLRVEHPSVIDGAMDPSHWLPGATPGTLLKLDFDERAFCNLDGYCYDAVFDLAGFAAACEDQEVRRHLRKAFADRAAGRIDAERWLLYQLFHLRRLQRQERKREGERPEIQRALSRRQQEYFEEVWFKDVRSSWSGPLCAIDIDGVLERGLLGFSAITPAGARSLRALSLHGYRPVLVSGRSLAEIRERCRAYGLAGGVAEYGAVIYNHRTGRDHVLLGDDDRSRLERLRRELPRMENVHLDSAYRHAVRAYRFDAAGARRGLLLETIALALAGSQAEGRLQPVAGASQTDFIVAGMDKGTGLRALAADLAPDAVSAGEMPVALAVGDTVSDLPMFNLAKMAFAPANADTGLRDAGVTVLKRPYQSGLAVAAARLLGHAPGGCSVCRAPHLSVQARLILPMMAAQDVGEWGKLREMLRIGVMLRPQSRSGGLDG